MNKLISTIILLLCAGVASADGPSYNYAQVQYRTILSADDFFGFEVDGSDFDARLSFEASEYLFVRGGYSKGTLEINEVNLDASSYAVELGFHNALSSSTDFVATIGFAGSEKKWPSFVYTGVTFASGSTSEEGALASIGLRSTLSKDFELYGAVTYVDLDDNQTTVSAGALYNFNETFAIGLGASRSDEVTLAGLGVRLYFGN